MKTYEIKKVNGQPDWREIPALQVEEIMWLPDADIRMTQQVCYDESALYVHQRAWEKNIRDQVTGPLGSICQDSCMEFFFSPDSDERYFNLECNPIGNTYFGFGAERSSRVRLILKDAKELLELKTERLSDGWKVQYRLPLHFIQMFYPHFSLKPGQSFTANCYKCGDKTEHPHYLAWNPLTSATPDFHRPMDFGRMILK